MSSFAPFCFCQVQVPNHLTMHYTGLLFQLASLCSVSQAATQKNVLLLFGECNCDLVARLACIEAVSVFPFQLGVREISYVHRKRPLRESVVLILWPLLRVSQLMSWHMLNGVSCMCSIDCVKCRGRGGGGGQRERERGSKLVFA